MRLTISLAGLALGVALLAACNARDGGAARATADADHGAASVAPQATSAPQPHSDGVRRIPPDEARAALERGEAVAYDVRDQQQYKEGHVKGARLVPFGEVDKRAAEFPKDKLIITYCA